MPAPAPPATHERLEAARASAAWGPHLCERPWGTVREPAGSLDRVVKTAPAED